MAKKKADFRVWIDGDLHAPLTELAKEHASTVPRQTNRILKEHLAPKTPKTTSLWELQDFETAPLLSKLKK